MTALALRGVGHAYEPGVWAVEPLDLELAAGGAYALLGPSGCGKTTLLSILSGLLRPSAGSVWLGERDVTALSPKDRRIAQVFQFPVVYEAMSVRDNLAFPLRNHRVPEAKVAARVEQVAALLDLDDVLGTNAAALGADLQQRVSLGRGLVREDVVAVLLDEPLTTIDPQARWLLRKRLKALHASLGVTWIYVTHDQEEALTFADEVLLMDRGKVVQRATPRELFERPEHTFAGHFIGSPGMNLVSIDAAALALGGQALPLPAERRAALPKEGPLELGIRPEHVCLGEGELRATVRAVRDRGSYRLVELDLGGVVLRARSEAVDVGGEVRVTLPSAWLHFYRDGRRIDA